MSLKPIPLTADPQDPDSPKGAIPVDIYGVSGGGGGAVDSVNSQTGDVVLSAGDVGAAPSSHTHAIGDVTGLQDALDSAGGGVQEFSAPLSVPPSLQEDLLETDLYAILRVGSLVYASVAIAVEPGNYINRPIAEIPPGFLPAGSGSTPPLVGAVFPETDDPQTALFGVVDGHLVLVEGDIQNTDFISVQATWVTVEDPPESP